MMDILALDASNTECCPYNRACMDSSYSQAFVFGQLAASCKLHYLDPFFLYWV